MRSSNVGIRYGDYITIRHSKPYEGYLSADGLLFGDTYLMNVDSDIKTLEDCVWEVHVQNQYSALKEYEQAVMFGISSTEMEGKERLHNKLDNIHIASKTKKVVKSTIDKQNEKIHELKVAMLNERRLNIKMMSLKVGKPVVFGDLIQLRHVKSQKFLTINSYMLAKNERENLRVLVQNEGDSSSCLIPMPRFKTDREGQIITNNSELFIRLVGC